MVVTDILSRTLMLGFLFWKKMFEKGDIEMKPSMVITRFQMIVNVEVLRRNLGHLSS